jgi:hypothetical protein
MLLGILMRNFLILMIIFTSAWAQVPPQNRPGYCHQRASSPCVDSLLNRLPRWDQDEERELKQIEVACAGNIGSECVELASKYIPWYELNNKEDLLNLARKCALTEVSCMNKLIPQLSRWDYNKLESFSEVARACARVTDVKCIDRRCNLRDYRCTRSAELLRAARACYTPCY